MYKLIKTTNNKEEIENTMNLLEKEGFSFVGNATGVELSSEYPAKYIIMHKGELL